MLCVKWGFALSILTLVTWIFGAIANHVGRTIETIAWCSCFITFGPHLIWVLLATKVRFSFEGKVAAGEFLKDHIDTPDAWAEDRYMHYTGMWLKWYLVYIFLIFFCLLWSVCYFTSFYVKIKEAGQ